MRFQDIIGQQEVISQLRGMVKENRLSHALFFLSKPGAGGLSLAMALSQYLVCEKINKPEAGSHFLFESIDHSAQSIPDDACGICPACVKASSMIHPDIHFSYPVITKKSGDKPVSTDFIQDWREFVKQFSYGNAYDWMQFIGAENKQGNITAHECNEIIRMLNLKSFESGYKILIMWMPEYLGNEGNKLLKLIEEPPPDTLFILVAEDESKILNTILSRTQLIRIPALQITDIEKALIEKAKAEPEKARMAAAVSEGSYREALQILQHAESDWLEMIRNWLNAALRTGPAEQMKWVNETSALGREKQKQMIRYFHHLLELCVRLRILGRDLVIGPVVELDFAERFNKSTSMGQQQVIMEELDKSVYHIERNANAKILFTALTIRLYHIIKDNVITELA
ncbi:MAG: ATP-binding protein [Chitinophagaceae bacterium]